MRGPHPNNETGHIGWRLLPFNGACFSLFGCFPSSGPGCARSTFPVGEGFLRRGSIQRGLALTVRGPLHTRPCGATLSRQERAGIPSGGGFPYLPLGEGAAAAADEGRYQVGSACRPTPVRAFGPATLSQERVGGPHTRQGFAGPPSPLERVFSKFPERNPLLLGTLMVEYPRWLWPA